MYNDDTTYLHLLNAANRTEKMATRRKNTKSKALCQALSSRLTIQGHLHATIKKNSDVSNSNTNSNNDDDGGSTHHNVKKIKQAVSQR
jgi:hypothetical protein